MGKPWVEAWSEAVSLHWGARRPEEVRFLLSVARNMTFRAPEEAHIDVRRAWEVYQDQPDDDTEIGRCAVALAYAIQEDVRR